MSIVRAPLATLHQRALLMSGSRPINHVQIPPPVVKPTNAKMFLSGAIIRMDGRESERRPRTFPVGSDSSRRMQDVV